MHLYSITIYSICSGVCTIKQNVVMGKGTVNACHTASYLNNEGLVSNARSQTKQTHVSSFINKVLDAVENSSPGGWDSPVDATLADGLPRHTRMGIDVLDGRKKRNHNQRTLCEIKAEFRDIVVVGRHLRKTCRCKSDKTPKRSKQFCILGRKQPKGADDPKHNHMLISL